MSRGDAPQAQALYRAGMEMYGRGEYENALSSFDRAISLGDRSWKVLDAKAATMNKMGGAWRNSAFEVASGLCKKYGDRSHRPWYRVGSILLAMGLLDASERSITRGLTLAKDEAARKPFLALRETGKRARAQQAQRREVSAAEAEAERKSKMCFTHLLTSDILYLVAQSTDDPHIALRMAGVCSDWRAAMLGHGALWSHLRVGKLRPVAKAELWLKRSKGRIVTVEITCGAPKDMAQAIATTLAPAMERVKHIRFHCLDNTHYLQAWSGVCRELRTLRVCVEYSNIFMRPLDMFGVLHPECTTLEHVDFWQKPDVLDIRRVPDVFDISAAGLVTAAQLASLRYLRLGEKSQLMSEQSWIPQLAAAAPRLEHLELHDALTTFSRENPDPVTLHSLTRLEVCDRTGLAEPTTTLLTPNLLHYSAWNWDGRWPFGSPGPNMPILNNVRGLPRTLTSLDLGRCAFAQADLLALLAEFKALRFLNVSFCGLDNNFLEALVDGALPRLTALSIAGHDTISSGPLRRLVLKRLGVESKAKPQPTPAKRSAFAATRRAAPKPTSTPKVEAASSQAASQEPLVPISWLCLDQCNHADMNVDILTRLRQHVRFLSHHNGRLVEDRVRGRGEYAWDADIPACSDADGCHLRKRRADEDVWYVHHTCKKAAREGAEGVELGPGGHGEGGEAAKGWSRT